MTFVSLTSLQWLFVSFVELQWLVLVMCQRFKCPSFNIQERKKK